MTGTDMVKCPVTVSCRRACATDRKIELEPEIYDDEEGGHRVGYCYQCHPAEPFEIPLDVIPEVLVVAGSPEVKDSKPVSKSRSRRGVGAAAKVRRQSS